MMAGYLVVTMAYSMAVMTVEYLAAMTDDSMVVKWVGYLAVLSVSGTAARLAERKVDARVGLMVSVLVVLKAG